MIVVTESHEFLIRTLSKELAVQLDPTCFWMICRSTIVDSSAISSTTRDPLDRLRVKLKSTAGDRAFDPGFSVSDARIGASAASRFRAIVRGVNMRRCKPFHATAGDAIASTANPETCQRRSEMSIKGQVNLITNAVGFFTAVLSGDAPPDGSWASATGMPFGVEITGAPQAREETFRIEGVVDESDGTFSLAGFREGLPVDVAAISLKLHGTQCFRTEYFSAGALGRSLQLFLLQPRVPLTSAITAGQISANLEGSGLPGNTKLTSGPAGLGVAGSKEGAHLQFGVAVVPDVSFDLALFMDVELNGYDIHVGWPADICESANDVLKKIRKGLRAAGSDVNATVLKNIESALTSPPESLDPVLANQLLQNVSVQFVSVVTLNDHTWPLKDTGDKTPILFAQPVFGYPRRFERK